MSRHRAPTRREAKLSVLDQHKSVDEVGDLLSFFYTFHNTNGCGCSNVDHQHLIVSKRMYLFWLFIISSNHVLHQMNFNGTFCTNFWQVHLSLARTCPERLSAVVIDGSRSVPNPHNPPAVISSLLPPPPCMLVMVVSMGSQCDLFPFSILRPGPMMISSPSRNVPSTIEPPMTPPVNLCWACSWSIDVK